MAGKKSSFSGSVSQWVAKSRLRTEAVFKTAVQEVALDANTPVERGGRMRVDTGFLRNSLVADLNNPPSGPSDPKNESRGNADDVALVILGATVNDVIWVGWSARYARVREYYDGFLKAAAQRWPEHVRKATAEARLRFK